MLVVAVSMPTQGAPPKPPARWTTTLVTGLADTFQLTLGGAFGNGPAWQSRIESGLTNAWSQGDSVYVCLSESLGLDPRRSDWQANVEYRRPVWEQGRQQLAALFGFQHWKFANVKTGTNDWLTHEALIYRAALPRRLGVIATSDSWTLLKSPLPKGSLLHTQVWVEHVLHKSERVSVTFRHGPAHTYSWEFYGTNGHRVIRYQTLVAITFRGGTRVEGGIRRQLGLQPSIPDNNFWQFSIAKVWSR